MGTNRLAESLRFTKMIGLDCAVALGNGNTDADARFFRGVIFPRRHRFPGLFVWRAYFGFEWKRCVSDNFG